MSTVRLLLVLLPCLTGVVALSRPPTRPPAVEHRPPLLPRKELLLVLGAGYKHILADYYWILTAHATGMARTNEEYLDVYYLADLATDLDPLFRHVYAFAGVVVPFNFGRETWVNTRESSLILRKGLDQFPQDVYMRIVLAYNLSYFEKEYRAAAQILEETSRLPGAPAYLPQLATRLYAQAGEVDMGLALAESLAAAAPDQETREAFEHRILELKLERELQAAERAAAAFQARAGRAPRDIAELVSAGDLPSLPVDPLGGDIFLGSDGKAYSTAQNRRLKMYDPLVDAPQPRP